jgi:hypothetical protein
MERRHINRGRRRADQSDRCPLTEYQAMEIIERLNKMEPKINLIHDRMASAKSFLIGARMGATLVITILGSIGFLIYSFASGKISLSQLWKGIQAII